MSSLSLLRSLLSELLTALAPIERLRDSPGELAIFLDEIGWPPPPGYDPTAVVTPFDISVELEAARALVTELQQEEADLAGLVPELRDAVMAVIQKVQAVADPGGLPAPYDTQAFWASFPGELFEYLLRLHIEGRLPVIAALLQFVGVVAEEDVPASAERAAYVRRSIEWSNLGRLFTEPDRLLRETYDWGAQPYRHDRLLRNLRRILGTLHRLDISYPSSGALDDYYSPTNASRKDVRELFGPLLEGFDPVAGVEYSLGLFALPVPPEGDADGAPVGLALGISSSGALATEIDAGFFDVLVRGGFETAAGPRLEIRPDSVSFVFAGSPPTYDAAVGLAFGREEPTVLLGSEGGHRLQLGRFSAELGLKGTAGDPEATFQIGLTDLEFVIQMAEGDGFLKELFGTEPQTARASAVIEWSSIHGLTFVGGASLGVTIALHLELGPLRIEELSIGIGAATGEPFALNIGVTVGLTLGPLSGTVKRMGVRALLEERADGAGTFGNVDLGFGFLPPTGAGFAMDTGGLVGGGYLEFDEANERYAGILALMFGEIGIVAIGLITTRMPDGSQGFSMLVSIGVTFDPPIQLSMGFTLSGVGGLIGVNRSMEIDVLREGVKKRTLDSILFPDPAEVIPNAAKIISDLRAVFPPEEGRFVVGPMVQIGYGSPNIIVADIGIFLELFDPLRIVLLGQLAMDLPEKKDPIVRINLDIVGVLDFEKKELSFQASLYDSGVLTFELFGDAAFFLSWGAQPEFAMSLGGFHPKFTPPPPPIVFDGLRRLGLSLSKGSDFRLTCGCYQALTPNSLQFGARVDLYAAAMGAVVTGHLGFDTLIYFSPFSFEIALGAAVNISYQGASLADVRVTLTLSGPTPWNARGVAVIKVLFFDVDVRFSFEWGRDDAARLDPVDPWPALRDAFGRAESWGGRLPAAASMVEALREIEDEPAEVAPGEEPAPAPVVVHPAGSLEVRENVAPLGMRLRKFGNAPVAAHDTFRVDRVTTADGDELAHDSVDEFFARGQFEVLSSAQKLSVPSFERMPGGVTTAASTRIRLEGAAQREKLRYESIVIKSDRTSETASDAAAATASWSVARFLLAGGAARRAALRSAGKARFAHRGAGMVGTAEETYVVVDRDTLEPVELDVAIGVGNGGVPRTIADQAHAEHSTLHPEDAERLIVVAEHEAEAVT